MRVLRRFKADQQGATAMLFGLAALPLLGAVGAAVDYGRAANYQSRMQLAADATALAIVREPSTLNAREIQQKGELYLTNTLRSEPNTRLGAVSVTRVGNTVTVSAAATMDTALMKAVGIRTMPIGAKSEAVWGSGTEKIEVALVLDNTGSMDRYIGGKRRMDELKAAAKDLLKKFRTLADQPDSVKVSIVPFDTEVRLDANAYRYKPWFRWNNEKKDRPAWTGYVIDRYGSYATSDEAPTSSDTNSLFVPQRKSDYSADLPAIRPLTSLKSYSDYTQLNGVIDGMQPRGNTNIALGAIWGLATLSRSEPFTEGAASGTKGVKKYMIVLTDGDNTESHIDGKSYNSLAEKNEAKARAMVAVMDKTTLAACQAAKDAKVEVFTVKLLDGNETMLKSCASNSGNYFDVQNSGQLSKVFEIIFNAISGTRISS
ncbi:vWA domain-containing protein [Enterovirga aerilata]|uniref:VWA domain-containing protein n=1 Tax=Enterovirga aerilata TaxID=2730920 RepID=A0A849I8J6_9HYPH|nr:TadE/TadG family type IV pilus assembly protein [Enterovirga sp. DB1703]NNM73641.1 VWA domain-containing protein [Enterovirga sp. DB1703]